MRDAINTEATLDGGAAERPTMRSAALMLATIGRVAVGFGALLFGLNGFFSLQLEGSSPLVSAIEVLVGVLLLSSGRRA